MLEVADKLIGKAFIASQLSVRVLRKNGTIEDLGVVCRKAVTDDFVHHLVDCLQANDVTFSDYKYHDSGTGTTAAVAGDTGLETPCGEARTTGTQIEGATGNIYRSVATHTYAGNFAITEHGLFNTLASTILMDRHTFTAINIVANDRIEFTYEITFTAGG